MNPRILSTDEKVFFFPVRHHSPAAALLIEKYIRETRPAAVLIEGPADFNPQMAQLALPHTLPIAIYSYAVVADRVRAGVFYPFCDYSPEWRAVQAAREIAAPVAFIDKPWSQMLVPGARKNRYSDAPHLRSNYIEALCKKFAVQDFNDLWDVLFEIDQDLSLTEYLRRCHHLCYLMRLADGAEHEDIAREEFMAAEIGRAVASLEGQILVVTGGFHSYALFARLNNLTEELSSIDRTENRSESKVGTSDEEMSLALLPPLPDEEVQSTDSKKRRLAEFDQQEKAPADDEYGEEQDADCFSEEEEEEEEEEDNDLDELDDNFEDAFGQRHTEQGKGISLTPYSYERLDSLVGYEAGMPGPGFYHEVFMDRLEGATNTYRKLLFNAVKDLRARKQLISSADVIAVESTASGLAALRGHRNVWRRDLIDGILGALVKDEVTVGLYHPLQEAVDCVMRGDRVGRLADGTSLPPLVANIGEILTQFDLRLTASQTIKRVELDLDKEVDRVRSCMLHRLHCLEIPGYNLDNGPAHLLDNESGTMVESWTISKHNNFEAACIEAAIYGSTLADASALRLVEKSSQVGSDSALAAQLLLESCLMGFSVLSGDFCQRLLLCIDRDSDLVRMTLALRYLLFLYRYDDVLKEKPIASIGDLLLSCFDRCVWLLDLSGTADHNIGTVLRTILEAFERCETQLEIDRNYFVDVLNRVRLDDNKDALLRGAATGALWTLNEAPPESVIADMSLFARPEQLGDFLTGLFLLAREASGHRKELLIKIDELLMQFSTEEYLEALPHLRLAFSVFSPREKYHMARIILAETEDEHSPLSDLDLGVAASAMMVESRIKEILRRFGLRGMPDNADNLPDGTS